MNNFLELEGRQDLEGADVAYFMNATDNPGSEGYSQLLPVAAADAAGANSVTIFPCGIYSPANAKTIETMEEGDEKNLGFNSYPEVDESKAAFLDTYSDERGLGFDSRPVESLMDEEAYWEGVERAAGSSSPDEIQDQMDRWWMDDDWFDNVPATKAVDSMPVDVPISVVSDLDGFTGRELYTLLQAGEYTAAEEQGYDVVTGISSEESYQKFAEESLEGLEIEFARSSEPVDLEGENDGKPPYVENDRDWVQLDDSPQEVARKLEQADQTAVEQIQDIARQLDDDIMQEALEQ